MSSEAVWGLVGALLGGLLSLGGTVGVSRYEARRRTRLELHLDALPSLAARLNKEVRAGRISRRAMWAIEPDIEAIERLAQATGRRDARQARAVHAALENIGGWLIRKGVYNDDLYDHENDEAHLRQTANLVEAVTNYQRWLARRIR